MDEIVKYFQSLEQRLAALETAEAKEAEQENRIALLTAKIGILEARIAEQENRIAELEARPATVAAPEVEPEVEVEFEFDENYDEPEESAEQESEAIAEPEPEVAPAPATEAPVAEAPIEQPEPAVEEKPKAAFDPSIGAPVDNIRKAISVGDRFLFVRELFGGKGELLQIVIDELNEMHSLEEANAYLDKHFNWDKESKTYQLFENILKRRYC